MKKLLINILLFFVAITLLLTIGVYALIYAFIDGSISLRSKGIIKYWGDLLYSINLGIDMIGNVMLSEFLNDYALKDKTIYPFGNVTQTISHVLAVNYLTYDNLKPLGKFLARLLNKIDKGHMEKSL